MVNRATQIVCDMLMDYNFYGIGWDSDYIVPFETAEGVKEDALQRMEEDADEYYESDWFPLVATKSIRDTIDWNYIAQKHNDEVYRTNVWLMFDSDNEDYEWCEPHEQPMYKDGLKCGGCLAE